MGKNNLKKFRGEVMMSKAELARKAKVSPITIARIENGMPCRLETMRKIIRGLGKKLSDREIEDLYDSGDYRLIQERSDFLLPQIIDFVRTKKWMNLRPEYQRRLVWDDKKRSLFIESLLMNIPIPAVFLFETAYNRYEVMDGQQRISANIKEIIMDTDMTQR